MFNFGTIIKVFAITIRFNSFNWISSDNLDLNKKSIEKCKQLMQKMLFILFSTSYNIFQKQTEIFEHYANETWLWTCDLVVLKLYKPQTKSENHEPCLHIMISYVLTNKNLTLFYKSCHTYYV
jgi:hypothetical protein